MQLLQTANWDNCIMICHQATMFQLESHIIWPHIICVHVKLQSGVLTLKVLLFIQITTMVVHLMMYHDAGIEICYSGFTVVVAYCYP